MRPDQTDQTDRKTQSNLIPDLLSCVKKEIQEEKQRESLAKETKKRERAEQQARALESATEAKSKAKVKMRKPPGNRCKMLIPLGVTAAELSARTGIAVPRLSQILNGVRVPNYKRFLVIASALKLSPEGLEDLIQQQTRRRKKWKRMRSQNKANNARTGQEEATKPKQEQQARQAQQEQ